MNLVASKALQYFQCLLAEPEGIRRLIQCKSRRAVCQRLSASAFRQTYCPVHSFDLSVAAPSCNVALSSRSSRDLVRDLGYERKGRRERSWRARSRWQFRQVDRRRKEERKEGGKEAGRKKEAQKRFQRTHFSFGGKNRRSPVRQPAKPPANRR